VRVQPLPDSPWTRHLPAMTAGALTSWLISPSFDALERNLERPSRRKRSPRCSGTRWRLSHRPGGPQSLSREPASHGSPFQRDFSTRLDPQPGKRVVFARTEINLRPRSGEEAECSDTVMKSCVYLNGQPLYAVRQRRRVSATRTSRLHGRLKRRGVPAASAEGRNELLLAIVSWAANGDSSTVMDLAPK
jgi:hypothetical protein